MTTTVTFERKRVYMRELEHGDGYAEFGCKATPEEVAGTANLVSSETNFPGVHMPAIDIDLPCRLVESSTPGHFHLYIDHPMTWDRYTNILLALARAGVVEDGYYKASVNRGASYLRLPGVKKLVIKDPFPDDSGANPGGIF